MRTTVLMLSWLLGCGDDVAEGADDELGQIVDWGQNSNAEDPTDTGRNDEPRSGPGTNADGDETGDGTANHGANNGPEADTGETTGEGGDEGVDADTGGASAGSVGALDTAGDSLGELDSDADGAPDAGTGTGAAAGVGTEGAGVMAGLQTYAGDWELRIQVDSLGLSPSDDVCSGETAFSINFDADPPTVAGEGTCTFTSSGFIATLITFGVADSLGPFSGVATGTMTSSVDAEGVMPIEIIEGELLSVAWEGTLTADGVRFGGSASGTELVATALPAVGEMEIPFDYEIDFETSLVE